MGEPPKFRSLISWDRKIWTRKDEEEEEEEEEEGEERGEGGRDGMTPEWRGEREEEEGKEGGVKGRRGAELNHWSPSNNGCHGNGRNKCTSLCRESLSGSGSRVRSAASSSPV